MLAWRSMRRAAQTDSSIQLDLHVGNVHFPVVVHVVGWRGGTQGLCDLGLDIRRRRIAGDIGRCRSRSRSRAIPGCLPDRQGLKAS